MEAGLTLRIECRDRARRDFLALMLGGGDERPLFEEDVAEHQRPWFEACDELPELDWVRPQGDTCLQAVWTIGGVDWDQELEELLTDLDRAEVMDIYAAVWGDDGWWELWLLRGGQISRLDRWRGRPVEDLFEGRDDLGPVLDSMRAEAPRGQQAPG